MTTDCGDIFLGSGASITFVPENDIYFPSTKNPSGAFDGTSLSTIKADTPFSGVFSLVNDLYIGCLIERYDSSNAFQDCARITANTADTITFSPALSPASGDYFVITQYGAPVPAPAIAISGTTFTDEVTTVTFSSDDKADYSADYLVFTILAADGGGASTHAFWFDNTGAIVEPSHGAGASNVVDISDAGIITKEEYAAAFTTVVNGISNIVATRSGNVVTVTNSFGGSNSAATTTTDATNLPVVRATTGGQTATTTAKRLLADEWLGLVESITFPTTEVEMKQVNLALGGSRNYTYQYKGIETASGGNINLVSNHAAWLYYFFGRCTGVSASTSAESLSNAFTATTPNAIYQDTSVTETGPIFYRSIADDMTPPIGIHLDILGNMKKLTAPSVSSGSIQDAITYTFEEQNGELLPSFSLEQVFSKLPSSNTYRTTTDTYEDTNFVKIARGNRVNTMTITANENEEIKMTMDLNTRTVHDLETDEVYDARRGVTDETAFFNYDSEATFREPFFFSSGYFKAFGVSFLKINSLTLTMNNSLTERRFIGVGNKSIQEGIPAQRTYELQFTGHVVDDRLYRELVNQDENNSTTDGQMVELNFSKANGEEFTLKFKDYMVSANDFPLPDDKGPVVVDTTIMPRNLHSCSVTTHWVLQG
jgi:hypothetical protein